jgi:anthranilate phosphoribosyltransferase
MKTQALMHSIIQRVATGPDLSKNISFEEAEAGMRAILQGKIDPVQSAIFLIALRMKRETREENQGILAAILAESDQQTVEVDNLIDFSDPYSGYNRSIPVSSFLPALLAEFGFSCVIHALERVSPKFGLTHHHIVKAMGLAVDNTTMQAKARLENSAIGWSYIDQSNYCQGLHNLVPLRDKIIKRTVINTVETLIAPLRGRKTHSVLGYVHKPYPPVYADLLHSAGVDSSLLIRGVEGGVVPSLRQKGLMISYQGIEEKNRIDIEPTALDIEQTMRSISFPEGLDLENNKAELADYTVSLGKSALAGKRGMFYDALVLSASLVLWHMKKTPDLPTAAQQVRKVLDSGRVLDRLV